MGKRVESLNREAIFEEMKGIILNVMNSTTKIYIVDKVLNPDNVDVICLEPHEADGMHNILDETVTYIQNSLSEAIDLIEKLQAEVTV